MLIQLTNKSQSTLIAQVLHLCFSIPISKVAKIYIIKQDLSLAVTYFAACWDIENTLGVLILILALTIYFCLLRLIVAF